MEIQEISAEVFSDLSESSEPLSQLDLGSVLVSHFQKGDGTQFALVSTVSGTYGRIA